MGRERLIRLYKHVVTPFERGFDELVAYLGEKLDIKEIDLSEVSHIYISMMSKNVLFSNPEKNLKLEDVEFHAFEVIKNPKSEEYFKDDQVHFTTEGKRITVLIDKKTAYVTTNCGKLQLELLLACGVSQYAYDNETLELMGYLALLDQQKIEEKEERSRKRKCKREGCIQPV